jgi:CBS domain-containing protein
MTMAKTAKDIMSKEVIYVQEDDGVLSTIKTLKKNRISGVPVLDENNSLSGIISESDILKLIESESVLFPLFEMIENPERLESITKIMAQKKVKDVMSKPLVFVYPDTPISEIVSMMWSKDINRVPVVDEKGSLVGIIARADLLKIL